MFNFWNLKFEFVCDTIFIDLRYFLIYIYLISNKGLFDIFLFLKSQTNYKLPIIPSMRKGKLVLTFTNLSNFKCQS